MKYNEDLPITQTHKTNTAESKVKTNSRDTRPQLSVKPESKYSLPAEVQQDYKNLVKEMIDDGASPTEVLTKSP